MAAALFITAGALVFCLIHILRTERFVRAVGSSLDRRESGRESGEEHSDEKWFHTAAELDAMTGRLLKLEEADAIRVRDERDRELLEIRMQFAQLQNQINPHFLYNTLENIRARAILDDNAVIADMTESLSRFFRYNISKRTDIVKLSEELDNIRTYMHIQQYRFSNKFDFQVFIHSGEKGILDVPIPKMTLQPIVENAIFHGMEGRIGKGHIEIHIEADARNIVILVEDDGVGMSAGRLDELTAEICGGTDGEEPAGGKPGDGIAMRNINNRLKLLYGEDCGIRVSSTEGVGTEVELILPRKEEDT